MWAASCAKYIIRIQIFISFWVGSQGGCYPTFLRNMEKNMQRCGSQRARNLISTNIHGAGKHIKPTRLLVVKDGTRSGRGWTGDVLESNSLDSHPRPDSEELIVLDCNLSDTFLERKLSSTAKVGSVQIKKAVIWVHQDVQQYHPRSWSTKTQSETRVLFWKIILEPAPLHRNN